MRKRGTSDRAFTLVELLVVIALITILIALLLPVLSSVKRQAQGIQCQANLRTIGQATTIYTGSYGFFPTASIESDVGAAECWPVRLRNILKGNQGVFYCPAQDPRCQWKLDAPGTVLLAEQWHTHFGYNLGERLLVIRDMYFSYGVNVVGAFGIPWNLLDRGPGASAYRRGSFANFYRTRHRVTSVKSASELILASDTTADGVEDYEIRPYPRNLGEIGAPSQAPANVHRGGANVLFCDGHVEWRLQTELLLKYAPVQEESAKQRIWNIDNQPAQQW